MMLNQSAYKEYSVIYGIYIYVDNKEKIMINVQDTYINPYRLCKKEQHVRKAKKMP